jgi:peptide deformylase
MPKNVWEPTLPPGRAYKRENLAEIRKASLFIYQVGESPLLRKPSKRIVVKDIRSPVVQAKIAYLQSCLRRYTRLTNGKGRGLAGIQVGIHERLFVAYLGKETKNKAITVFINPKIEEESGVLLRYDEACMSANSLVAPVVRPAWIRFSYYDEQGRMQVWEQKDTTYHFRMLNRVLQHEIDHLEGIINIDKVPSVSLGFESFKDQYKAAKFEAIISKET